MSEFEIPIGSLEEQALKRKERLKKLKYKAREKDASSTDSPNNDAEKANLPVPMQISQIGLKDQDAEIDAMEIKNDDVISKITNEIDALKTPIIIDEIDLQNLAPRKPDWDLKRDVAKKIEILERRTQRAIAQIIRERLRSNDGQVDLQAVYSAQPLDS